MKAAGTPAIGEKAVIPVGAEEGVSDAGRRGDAVAGASFAAVAPGLEAVDHHFFSPPQVRQELQVKGFQGQGPVVVQVNGDAQAVLKGIRVCLQLEIYASGQRLLQINYKCIMVLVIDQLATAPHSLFLRSIIVVDWRCWLVVILEYTSFVSKKFPCAWHVNFVNFL